MKVALLGGSFNPPHVGHLMAALYARTALGSLSVFRGTADFVFYQRDLFTPEMRGMTLVVRRPGQAFEFEWNFQDR